MRNELKMRILVLQVAAGLVVAAMSSVDMIGKPARAVGLLGLGGGMFGAGVGFAQVMVARKSARRDGDSGTDGGRNA